MAVDVSLLRNRRVVDRRNRVSMGDLWERATWSAPDATAIIGVDGAYESPAHARLSYRQADDLANRVAHALVEAGLRDGDVAILLCENSVEAVVTKIGMAKAGVVAAPLNPSLAPDVVADVLRRIEPRGAIVDTAVLDRHRRTLTEAGVPVLATVAVGEAAPTGTASWSEFVAGQPATEPATEIHGDDIWQLLFTSGSTATPKAAMLSHHNTYYAALGWTSALSRGLRSERRTVLASYLPVVYHTGDVLTYAVALLGGTLVVGRRPDPVAVARGVSEHGVSTLWSGMPPMVAALVDAFADDPSLTPASLHNVIYGWAPLPEATFDGLQRLTDHTIGVVSIIGMTEVVLAHRFWLNEHEDLYRRTTPRDNYIGTPAPLLAARVEALEGRAVVPSDGPGIGEVVYRSPALTSGYYRDQVATDLAMDGEWFHTGDVFEVDEAGQRMMVDRIKDVVKSGGENVSSIRVEAVLNGHPMVERAAVVGVPDPRWGEAVTAVVIPVASTQPTEEELLGHCRRQLAGYEVPKAVVFVASLPTSVGGKLQKHLIRELAEAAAPHGSSGVETAPS